MQTQLATDPKVLDKPLNVAQEPLKSALVENAKIKPQEIKVADPKLHSLQELLKRTELYLKNLKEEKEKLISFKDKKDVTVHSQLNKVRDLSLKIDLQSETKSQEDPFANVDLGPDLSLKEIVEAPLPETQSLLEQNFVQDDASSSLESNFNFEEPKPLEQKDTLEVQEIKVEESNPEVSLADNLEKEKQEATQEGGTLVLEITQDPFASADLSALSTEKQTLGGTDLSLLEQDLLNLNLENKELVTFAESNKQESFALQTVDPKDEPLIKEFAVDPFTHAQELDKLQTINTTLDKVATKTYSQDALESLNHKAESNLPEGQDPLKAKSFDTLRFEEAVNAAFLENTTAAQTKDANERYRKLLADKANELLNKSSLENRTTKSQTASKPQALKTEATVEVNAKALNEASNKADDYFDPFVGEDFAPSDNNPILDDEIPLFDPSQMGYVPQGNTFEDDDNLDEENPDAAYSVNLAINLPEENTPSVKKEGDLVVADGDPTLVNHEQRELIQTHALNRSLMGKRFLTSDDFLPKLKEQNRFYALINAAQFDPIDLSVLIHANYKFVDDSESQLDLEVVGPDLVAEDPRFIKRVEEKLSQVLGHALKVELSFIKDESKQSLHNEAKRVFQQEISKEHSRLMQNPALNKLCKLLNEDPGSLGLDLLTDKQTT